ncbi:MAG: nucleotidyl transferase AbiEii/AbiGii toxin family protein [Chloroflexi bacterium]|nr:nucleotidyl transferase AbiEii/AbiGii toxin family protein [Chloroflexota bacterium]
MATLIQSLRHILESRDPLLPVETKRILLKEAMQARALDFLYNHPVYRRLNFYGGTCLHAIYELNRLSEDLDLDNGSGLDLGPLPDELLAYHRKTLGFAETSIHTQTGETGILRLTLKFPILNALGLSAHAEESLHLKVEISGHRQTAVILRTPVFFHGLSFVPAHFSLETMMAGKMLACLERSFQRGREGALLKGRDFYDLLWFMQKRVKPLEEKLARDGRQPYTTKSAMAALQEKVSRIRRADLAPDLLPMFESRVFIEAWLEGFQENFAEYAKYYRGGKQ